MRKPSDLPTGTVTFLFSDVEGSTELVQRLDTETYRAVLEQHQRLLREVFAAHHGFERGTQGDSFLVVFRDAPSALAAAVDAQRALAGARWPEGLEIRVRMGLHTGDGIPGGDDYVGVDINRAARIAAAAHGGQVLLSEPTRSLVERSLPAGVDLRDVGQHRFKGLELPERVHQVSIAGLRTDFPPVHSLTPRLTGAPSGTTTFLGRQREVDALDALIRKNRLVTLVGPGGTGKTRLAIELAERAAGRFAEGAVFVALESVADPELVGSAIAAALCLRDTRGRSARDQLLDSLSGRDVLLVLDNFEHVVDAASLVGDLLAAAPALKAVATSRAALRLAEEQIYPVAPLQLPDANHPVGPAELESIESVELFVDRARRVQPDFALTPENASAISDICRLVDGLPLGIELAAARITLLGPVGIRDRLTRKLNLPGSSVRGAPNRQRTLHEAIAWSYDLLDAPSRTLLRRLAVFAGGCRIEELTAVGQPAVETGGDVIDSLANLVDQSLVVASQRPDGVRYDMLGTIHDFGADRLAEDLDRGEIERRHALAYLAFAESNAGRLETREQTAASRQIALERDNLRAAIRWAIDHAEPEVASKVATALARFWWLVGETVEGRATFEAILGMPGADEPTTWHMRALEGAGLIYYYGAQNERAAEAYRAQLQLARLLGDRQGEADAQFNLMFTQDSRGRTAESLAMLDQVAESYRALGDERSLARTTWMRALLMADAGRFGEGQQLLEGAVSEYRRLGDLPYEVQAISALALGGLLSGDRDAAAHWFPAALAIGHDLGDSTAFTVALPMFAAAALEFVSPAAAARLLGAYDAMSHRYGTRMPMGLEQGTSMLATPERTLAALGPDEFEAAMAAGQAMSPDEVFAYLDATIGPIGSQVG